MSNLRKVVVGLLSLISFALSSSAILAQAKIDEVVVAQPAALPDAADASIAPEDLELLLLPLTAPELAKMAEKWQQNVRTHFTDIARLNLTLRDAANGEAEKIRERLLDLSGNQRDLLEKYSTVLEKWEQKGGTQEETASHRSYITALKRQALQTTDVKTIFKLAVTWLLSAEGGLCAWT